MIDEEVLQDELAVSLARIIAAANKRAHQAGVNISESLNYGPKDYINQRGGDVIIQVEASNAGIKNVQRGQ